MSNSLEHVSYTGQLILVEVPVITVAMFAVIGWLIRRGLARHDERLERLEELTTDVKQSVALLIAGDLEDDAELKRTRARLHILENQVTAVKGRVEMLHDRLGLSPPFHPPDEPGGTQ